jgi:hypothetical protein
MRLKPVILFLALLVPPIVLFWSDISNAFEMQEIRRAPAYATATSAELRTYESKKKGREPSHYVYFGFSVAGANYRAVTTPTDKAGAAMYLSEPKTEIVYNANDPSKNTLKRYYDLRRNDSILRLLVIVGVASVAFALPVSLFWSWRRGWLRRAAQ